MNQVVTQSVQLPAHLAALAQFNSSVAVMGGIVSGPSIYQIGIKAARWRLQEPQGDEQVVPEHHLDVIIVDANPNLSKVFYLGAYNPAETEFKAPDCYSDNGVAPSSHAGKPQSNSCATCPNNVWGSRITATGSQTKACADSKRLAVILASNPTGPVYLLKVPPASLKNLYTFVESVTNRNIPLAGIVVRLSFDTNADFPKIMFTAAGWASVEQVQSVTKVIGSDEIKIVTGMNDRPAQGQIAAPVAAPAQPVAAPPAAAVAPTPPPPADPLASLGTAAPAPKRTRKPKAAPAAEAPPLDLGPPPAVAAAPAAAPAQAAVHADIPDFMNAAAAVPIAPQPTNSALDDLIAQALKV